MCLCMEIQPVHSEGDQPWDLFGRNDAKAETPVLWPPHAKSWLIGKGSDAGRHWGQEEKGMTEDEMAGWHHWLNGHESEWTAGVGDGQGGLACCDSWGHKESDTTERLNWIDTYLIVESKKKEGQYWGRDVILWDQSFSVRIRKTKARYCIENRGGGLKRKALASENETQREKNLTSSDMCLLLIPTLVPQHLLTTYS